jgi:hypothetical protein
MLKVHYAQTSFGRHALGEGIGVCGFTGKVTKDKKKVTCKLCKKMLRSNRYLG